MNKEDNEFYWGYGTASPEEISACEDDVRSRLTIGMPVERFRKLMEEPEEEEPELWPDRSIEKDDCIEEFTSIESEEIGDNEVYDDIISKYGNYSIPSEEDRDKLAKHFETALKVGMTAEEMDEDIKADDEQFSREIEEWQGNIANDEGIRWDKND